MNNQFLTIYVCMSYHIFRPFTKDVFKWMPVDVYIGGNEHGMYPVSNFYRIAVYSKSLHRLPKCSLCKLDKGYNDGTLISHLEYDIITVWQYFMLQIIHENNIVNLISDV